MAIPQDEPKSPEQGQQWVEKHAREHDRFAHVLAKYDGHRATHGCYDVYPYPNGSLRGTLAATHRARRILEVGAVSVTAPSGLPMAPDPERCRIRRARPRARRHRDRSLQAEGLGERLKVFAGLGAKVLPTLTDTYDLGYFYTDPTESLIDLEQFERLLKPTGLLISANLFFGQYAPIYPVWKKPRNIESEFSTAHVG